MSVHEGDDPEAGRRTDSGEEAYDEPMTSGDEAWVACPYCGAQVQLLLDPGGGSPQEYVEDCEVCCRPWQIRVRWDRAGVAQVDARTDDA